MKCSDFLKSSQFEELVEYFYKFLKEDGYTKGDFEPNFFSHKDVWSKLGNYPYPTNPKEVIASVLSEKFPVTCDKYGTNMLAWQIGKRLLVRFSEN